MALILLFSYCFYVILLLTKKIRNLQLSLQIHEDFTRKYIILQECSIEIFRNNTTLDPIIAHRAPSSSDIVEIGQIWIYNKTVYVFTSKSTWTQLAEQK